MYTQLPAVGLLHNTVPCVAAVVTVTLPGLSAAPVVVSFVTTAVVTGVFWAVVLLSGFAVIAPTLTTDAAELFVKIESGVALPVVVVIFTVPIVGGVNVVVQVIDAPLPRVATGEVGEQMVFAPLSVTPAPEPVTAQVAFSAVSAPAFLQIVTTVTGVPTVTVCVTAPVACISACATLVCTQCVSPIVHVVGGVVHAAPGVVQPVGGVAVLSVMTFAMLVVDAGSDAFTWTLIVAVAVPFAGTELSVIVHSFAPVSLIAQPVNVGVAVPAATAASDVLSGNSSKNA